MKMEAIDNLIARMQRAEQERDALRETVLSIGAQRDELLAKLDASERAASEMRRCLEHFQDEREAAQLGVPNEVLDALSSDAGRDYVPRGELENLDMRRAMEVAEAWRKGMTDAANISGSGGCLCPEDIRSARDAKKAE